MKSKIFFLLATAAAGSLLVACGGGGEGGATPPVATPTSLTAAPLTIPANFDFANFKTTAVKASSLTHSWTLSDPAKTYVTLWYLDANIKEQQVAFTTWGTLQALTTIGLPVQVPQNVTKLGYEVYEGSNSTKGEVTL